MRSIRLLAQSDYDFSGLAGGHTITIPLRLKIDVRRIGGAQIVIRQHSANVPSGASFAIVLKEAAPTPQDPGIIFRGRTVNVTRAGKGSFTAGSLTASYAPFTTAYAAAFLVVTQAPTISAFTLTISVDLVPIEKPNLWTPADIAGLGLTLWLDDRGQSSTSSLLDSWADQSGVTNAFTAGSTARPTLDTAVNTWPAPRFIGASSNFMLSSSLLSTLITATGYHGFAVVQPTSFSAQDPDASTNPQFICDGNNGYWGLFVTTNGIQAWHRATGGPVSTGSSAVTANAPHLVEWSYDGTNISCAVDGSISSTPVGSVLVLSGSLALGHDWTGSGYLSGAIASILVFNQHLNADNAAQVRRYLASKYGLPA